MSPNIELKTEVNNFRSSHSSTFVKASTYLSTVVARLYPSANPSSGCFRKRSIYAAGRGDRGGRRGGFFNGRGCGRGCGERGGRGRVGRGEGIGAHEDGNDISDITRYFEDSEWDALSNDTRKRITEERVRTKFLANKNRRTTSYVSAGKDNKNRLISQIITGFQNASRNESGFSGGVTCFPTNGSRAQMSVANKGSTSSNRNKTE